MADKPASPSVLQICSASAAVYGAVHSMMTLVDAQRAHGTRVAFVTRRGKAFGAQLRERGYGVDEVAIHTKIDPIAIVKIRNLIKRGRFDVVHTHLSTSTVNGTLAARLARVQCVATVHGLSGKLSFLAANHLIAVSHKTKQHLVDQGVDPAKVSVVYNGIHPPKAVPGREEARALLGLGAARPVLGTLARVTESKGVEHALAAVAKLAGEFPDLAYCVVGDGDRLEACRELAKELGLGGRVTFAGYQSDPTPYLASWDLMLFPSLQEAMGIAIVEAFAAGVPVVGTDAGGIPEVISADTGALCPAGDSAAMAEKAARLLRDPAGLGRMSDAARARAASVFGVETMVARTELVYRGLLDRSYALPLEPAQTTTPVV